MLLTHMCTNICTLFGGVRAVVTFEWAVIAMGAQVVFQGSFAMTGIATLRTVDGFFKLMDFIMLAHNTSRRRLEVTKLALLQVITGVVDFEVAFQVT